MEKTTRDEYLKALEENDDTDQIDKDENPELSVAERLALQADAPRRRVDGGVVTSDRYRPLTASQTAFVYGVVQGKTLKQAYKDAYPNDNSTDQGISANANRLFKHPKVQDMLQDAWGEIAENLVEDMTATKRYVMKQLLEQSKTAKQEGSKIKCLELLGKASGLFTQAEVKDERAVSADQLKGELAKYLRTLKRTTGISDVESRAV
jgi:hypothetical protein